MPPSSPSPSRRRPWPTALALIGLLIVVAALGRAGYEAAVAASEPDEVTVAVGGLDVDISMPPGPGPHPVIAHVPGGAWVTIDSTPVHTAFGFDDAVRDGWAVLTIPYRTGPGIDASDQAADVTSVLRWARSGDAAELGLGGPIVATGHSAGAHLLALATTGATDGVRPDALVLVAGIYDLAADVRASPLLSLGLRRAFGCGPQGCPPSELLLPATWVDPSDPPVTLVHGTGDRVAPTDGSVRFADALRAAGVPVSLEIVPGGHRGTEVDAAVRQALADARDQRGRASSSR